MSLLSSHDLYHNSWLDGAVDGCLDCEEELAPEPEDDTDENQTL